MKLNEIEKNNCELISGIVLGGMFFGLFFLIAGFIAGCCLTEWILWK